MSAARTDRPPNLRSLEQRIDNIAHREARPVRRIQRAVANTVIGQMLPAGVIRGGTAMKLRLGDAASRFTPDLDVIQSAGLSLDAYLGELEDRLVAGWSGFTGTLRPLPPPQPEDVPTDYIMRPFEIRLASVPVLTVDHQIAQKLHACTSVNPKTGGNERAHDLVDLQILIDGGEVDLAAVGITARRLFASRRGQPWPPTVVAHDGWDTIYAKAADGLDVIENVGDAVTWTNELIARIES